MNHAFLATLSTLMIGLCVIGVADAFHGHASDDRCESDGDKSQDGWITLFDGTSTEHFRGWKKEGFPDRGWRVVDGTLHKIAGAGGGDIITKEKYTSFDLRWEWKVAEGANSGVMYRVAEADDLGFTFLTGPEYQILEDGNHRDGQNPKTSTAALYDLIACNDKKELKPVGDWNTSRIVVEGDKVEHWLNGEKVVEYVLGSDELKALIANSKFKDWPRFANEPEGHIAFQDHGDDVWFRNIRIRELDQDADHADPD